MFGRLSLRYKFLLILALILVAATTAYFGLAIQLFNTDKKAYVYDSVGALAETLAEETATGILSAVKTMRLAALADASNAQGLERLFQDDDNFVVLALQKVDEAGTVQPPHALMVREELLASYSLERDFGRTLLDAFPASLAGLSEEGLSFDSAVQTGGPPLLAVTLGLKRLETDIRPVLVVRAFLRQDRRLSAFRRSTLYTNYLIDEGGELLAHSEPEMLESSADAALASEILASKVAKGVIERQGKDGVAKIVAYKKVGIGALTVISEIPRDQAFLASRRLVERSALFGVLVLSIAFLVSIIFSRRLTAALHRLYLATLSIAKGDFRIDVAVTSQDEVGALSLSFNRMAREIDRLLIETADKARMEKELETAQLVQDNFFPKGDIRLGSIEVSAYFRPASECGGDWWGAIDLGRSLLLLIGDATGHGVPAALITAAAHACTMTLNHLHGKVKDFALSPAFVLESLNAAIFHAGQGRVKMTFLAIVIDVETGRVRYANASHELPVLCRGSGEDAELDSFDARPDPCLGERLETRFEEHEDELAPADTLVLYTDGLIECRSAAGEEFGERRLTRAILKGSEQTATELKDELVARSREFLGDAAQEDDITLVVVRRLGDAGATRMAG